MTRNEFYVSSDSLVRAQLGSGFEDDPLELAALLDRAADAVCKQTGCFYDVQSASLVARQSLYCAPTIYHVLDQYIVDATGKERELTVRAPHEMTRLYGAAWRTATSADPPCVWVPEGTTRGRLYPAPSEDREDALVFEGFALTTSKITGSTAHLWPDGDDECPLPEDGQEAVLYKFTHLRCLPLMRTQPGAVTAAVTSVAPFMATIEREYRRVVGDLEADTARRYRKHRRGFGAARATIAFL